MKTLIITIIFRFDHFFLLQVKTEKMKEEL
jgi:hypothetical protein